MKKIIFVLLLFSGTQLLPNNNGYFGKKNMIKYELGIWHPYAAGVLSTYRPILHHCISFEHSFKSGSSFGIVVSRFDMKDQLSYRQLQKLAVPYAVRWLTLPDWNTYSNSTMVELNVKRYHRQFKYNPQGGYFSAGLFFMFRLG